MAAPKFKIRFTKDAVEERAPKDPGKGGFVKHLIPKGTEKEVRASSVNFWMARGCIEVIGQAAEPKSLLGVRLDDKQAQQPAVMTKKRLGEILAGIAAAIEGDDNASAVGFLKTLKKDEIDEPLAELGEDYRLLIDCASADAEVRGELAVNTTELLEAIAEARQVLLPPSRRSKS